MVKSKAIFSSDTTLIKKYEADEDEKDESDNELEDDNPGVDLNPNDDPL